MKALLDDLLDFNRTKLGLGINIVPANVDLAVAFAAALSGCSRGGAAEILETARFEEVQRNLPHARKLYQEILVKYPGTAEAEEAQRRLTALGGDGAGG